MRSRGPGRSPSWERASSYAGPPFLKCATVSRVPPSSGGNHRTVAALRPNPRISAAQSMLAVCSTSRGGGGGHPEERGHVAPPARVGLRGCP